MKLLWDLLSPLDSFCCGCSLDFGIGLIVIYHTMQSLWCIFTVFASVVLDVRAFGKSSLESQAFNFFCALLSLPFIVSGISGVSHRIESHLRVYLFWLLANVSTDGIFMALAVSQSGCSELEGTSKGSAYACGVLRIFNILYISLCLSGSLYCCFIVWSRCEELKGVDSQEAFKGMLEDSNAKEQAHLKKGLLYTGLFGLGSAGPPARPVVYGSYASPMFDGSSKIFGGQRHEMNYPPMNA